jgi:hypothetical protein
VERADRPRGRPPAYVGGRRGLIAAGESGLEGWSITLTGTDGTNTTLTAGPSGDWSYTVPAHQAAAGTTTSAGKEVQQAASTQTGNTVDQSVSAGGSSVSAR